MAFLSNMLSATGVLGLGAVGWFAANFIGAPVLALRKTRQEALGVAGRYCGHWPSVDYEDAVRKLREAPQARSAGVDLPTVTRNATNLQRACPDRDAASELRTS